MFDLVCIFTTGGVILFYKAFCVLKFDIIDSLIKKVLIQEKSSQYSYTFDPYTVKWKLANEFKLIFAVVYQELFHLSYVEELLELMRENYIKTIVPNFILSSNIFKSIPSFEDKFEETLRKWEERKKKDEKKASLMRSFDETKKGKEVTQKKEKDPTKKISKTNTVSNLSQNMDSIQPNELKKKNSQNDIELTQDEIEKNRSILGNK